MALDHSKIDRRYRRRMEQLKPFLLKHTVRCNEDICGDLQALAGAMAVIYVGCFKLPEEWVDELQGAAVRALEETRRRLTEGN